LLTTGQHRDWDAMLGKMANQITADMAAPSSENTRCVKLNSVIIFALAVPALRVQATLFTDNPSTLDRIELM
jgi:hypothetical protein